MYVHPHTCKLNLMDNELWARKAIKDNHIVKLLN